MASSAYADLRSQQADVLRHLPQSVRTWTDETVKRQGRELKFQFPDDVTRRYLYETWVKHFGGEACVGVSLDKLILDCIVATPSPSNPLVPLFTDIVKGRQDAKLPKGKTAGKNLPTVKPVTARKADSKDASAAKDKTQDAVLKGVNPGTAEAAGSAPAGTEAKDKKCVDKNEKAVGSEEAKNKGSPDANEKPVNQAQAAMGNSVQDVEKVSKASAPEVAAVPASKDAIKKPSAGETSSSTIKVAKEAKVSTSSSDEKENRPSANTSAEDTSVELRDKNAKNNSSNAVQKRFSFFKWRPSSMIERRSKPEGGVKLRKSMLVSGSSVERGIGRQPSFAAPSALKFLIYLSKLLETSRENREALDEAGMIIGFCSLLLALVSFKTRTQVESYFRDSVADVLAAVVPSASFRGVVPVPNRRFLEVLHEQLTRGSQLQTQISILVVCQYVHFREAGDRKFSELDMKFLKEGYLNHTIGTGLGTLSLLRALQEKTKLNPAALLRFLNSDVTRESCERVEEFLKYQTSLAGKKTGRIGKQSAQHSWPWCRVVDPRQYATLMTRANAFYAVRVVSCLDPPPEDRMWKSVEFVPEEVKRHEREWADMFRRHLQDGSIKRSSDSMIKYRECGWARALDSMYFVEDFELLTVGSCKKRKTDATADDSGESEKRGCVVPCTSVTVL